MALYLRRCTSLFEDGGTLLHIAPEPRLEAELRAEGNLRYVSADKILSRTSVMTAMDVTHLGFQSQIFDVVICNHVLEHVPDDVAAMREIRRVMKPDGWAILQVPISSTNPATYEDERVQSEADRQREFGQADHVRVYGRDYVRRLESAGFQVQEFQSVDTIGGDAVREFALIDQETLFRATRRDT